jgi:hypothetical protein
MKNVSAFEAARARMAAYAKELEAKREAETAAIAAGPEQLTLW